MILAGSVSGFVFRLMTTEFGNHASPMVLHCFGILQSWKPEKKTTNIFFRQNVIVVNFLSFAYSILAFAIVFPMPKKNFTLLLMSCMSTSQRLQVGTVIGERETATVLLVLDNVIVIAADSRISSITNWIVKLYRFKVRKIRENLASVAYYNENIVGAENRLDHLEDKGKKTCSHKSLIRATSKFMKNNVPWKSFGGHRALIDSRPMAHLVLHEAKPQHVAGCRWEANWDKCNCWDIDSKRQILCKEDSRNILSGQWRK
ncbi:hypothetical protein ACFX13_048047 [Malus domestica]